MSPHHSPSTFAVQIKVPYMKRLSRLLQLRRILRINPARQSKLRRISNLQGLIEISRLDHRQNRPKNLLLRNASLRINVRNHRSLHEITIPRCPLPANQNAPLFLPDINITKHRLEGRL